ncbi:MAG: pilus assembly protein PilV [Betaproteobacteria bacterium]
MTMNIPANSRRAQGGAFLLEALIAILIVSFGILGIVGLQARSLKAVGDAQYRGEAAYYAETLAGRMWAHDPTDVKVYFGTSGTGFTTWSDQVTAAGTGLPGAAVIPPTIAFSDLNSANGVMAVISIWWQNPGDEKECGGDTSDVNCYHKYVTSAVVGSNKTT